MRIIGIDPGLTRCGYAVLEQAGSKTLPLVLGVVTTPKEDSIPKRLAQLHGELGDLINEFSPQIMAIEKVFIEVNRKSGIAVSQAAGIAMALGFTSGCEVSEYTPKQIKKAVTSWGGADKDQMREMIKILLGLSEAPKIADSADAAAVALCHLAQAPKILESNDWVS